MSNRFALLNLSSKLYQFRLLLETIVSNSKKPRGQWKGKLFQLCLVDLPLDSLVFASRGPTLERVKNYALKGSIGHSYRPLSSGSTLILGKKRKKLQKGEKPAGQVNQLQPPLPLFPKGLYPPLPSRDWIV